MDTNPTLQTLKRFDLPELAGNPQERQVLF
jgi:hypothetical protein